ncbi:Hypothetical protein SSCIU_02706 [Mammaliicoccus sciuri]|nr:Hypothetical protein SSCIU_02706 [Mammaliicoccus sciuri]
MEETGT